MGFDGRDYGPAHDIHEEQGKREAKAHNLVLATFGINCYIAATVNGAAGVVLWRKLMSAVTYLVAFIAAGEMRFVLEYLGNASGSQKSKIVLIGLIAATVTLELLLSTNSQYDALWKLSYKSTSVISFILAVASVAAAALHQPRHEVPTADKTIVTFAAGTLAFYAVQSFTCNVWRPIFDKAIYTMATGIQTGEPRPAAAILLGILIYDKRGPYAADSLSYQRNHWDEQYGGGVDPDKLDAQRKPANLV